MGWNGRISVKKGVFQGVEERQTKERTSLAEVGGSMSGRADTKALQEDLQSLGFTPSLAKLEMGRLMGDEGPAHKKTGKNESG